MWVKNCIRHRLSLMGGDSYRNALLIKGLLSTAEMERLRMYRRENPPAALLAEKTGQQRNQGDAHQSNAAASHELFYPQLGVKLCSMAGGGVQKIYMVFLREPSRRDRSGSDLFHLRDGFEIKMNFDRNVSCFIFVNALMHDDFFD